MSDASSSDDADPDTTGDRVEDRGRRDGPAGGEAGPGAVEGPVAARADSSAPEPSQADRGPRDAPHRPNPPRRTGVFVDPTELRAHVGNLLRTIVGTHRVDPFGNFSFDHGTARVFVTVTGSPMGPMVGVFSVTNTGLDLTPDLAAWMARTNHGLLLGSLSWDEDNRAVWLRHNLLGSHLDVSELGTAVQAIAATAARVDDHVATRFGGLRFADRQEPEQDEEVTVPEDGAPEPTGDGSAVAGGEEASNTTGYL